MQNRDESVGSVNIPTPPTPTEQVIPQSGSPMHSGLLCQCSYSPSSQMYTPYGVPQSDGATCLGTPTE